MVVGRPGTSCAGRRVVCGIGRSCGMVLLRPARSRTRVSLLYSRQAMVFIQILPEGCRDGVEKSLGLLASERVGVVEGSVEERRVVDFLERF